MVKLRRKQIQSLFAEMRSSCPNSNSICSSVSLRKTGRSIDGEQEEFEVDLKWVPDEPSWSFLKTYALEHSLEIKTTGKTLTLFSSKEEGIQ
jgi:hypothetical protein